MPASFLRGLLTELDLVRTKAIVVSMLAAICVLRAYGAEKRDVERVLGRFRSIRPTAAELAIYELDWMPTLEAAKEAAARQGRPILLVLVTNSFGDIASGHC